MREPRPEWVARVRAITGCPTDTIRANELLHRYEFVLAGADGVPRSQFLGVWRNPMTGEPIAPDPVTGLFPFRDLDEAAMGEVCASLVKTFVGNPHDGAGSPRKEVLKRRAWNEGQKARHWQTQTAELEARFRDRRNRLLGYPQVSVPVALLDEHGRPLGKARVA